ncbi:MAG: LamG domain-containing protein [Sphingobacteriaceae bacterium]|nr:LamG domain-containing protein [Sphingobacteriaceae bacterium]
MLPNLTKSTICLFYSILILLSVGCEKKEEPGDDPEESTNKGLIAYWKFDGNGKDSSANKNDATLKNLTPTPDRFGKPDKAFYFNGIDSYASVQDNKDLRLSKTDFTLNAWVRMDSYNASFGSNILSKHIAGMNNGWGWSVCGYASPVTGPGFYGPGGGSINAVGKKVVSLNDWHMLTTVYELSTKKLSIYLDGELDTTASNIAAPNKEITAMLFIGKDEPTNKYYFKGALDDISIHGNALNAQQIKTLYLSNKSDNKLIAYWPMDGDGKDISGNGNHATLFNLTHTRDRSCNIGGALFFNGVDGYATVADKISLRLNNTDFTLNTWIKMQTYNTSYGSVILSKRIAGINSGWSWGVAGYFSNFSGVYSTTFGPGGGNVNALGTTTIPLNSWHMITSVYNVVNKSLAIYVDGELDNISYGLMTPNEAITSALYIGKDEATGIYYMHGALDDIRIYGKALSVDEVKSFYTSTKGGCEM